VLVSFSVEVTIGRGESSWICQFDILEKLSRDGSGQIRTDQFKCCLYSDFKLILVGLQAMISNRVGFV
jgi:hypothetical protein